MSGGVDSSVAAKLLQDQGYEVVGFFMKLWHDPTCQVSRENACCDEKSLMDARAVADLLNIKFYVVDARDVFKKWVVDYFIDEYKNLRTPNPCIMCNEKIKFDWLLKYAEKLDCDFLATGHYARITSEFSCHPHEDGDPLIVDSRLRGNDTRKGGNDSGVIGGDNKVVYRLLKGKDESKDQTYFLYRLNQEKLAKILFPIGEYTKPEVRALAKKWGLPVHEKVESQEICFIQSGSYREFLRKYLPEKYFKAGDIIDKESNIIGKHEGLVNYTIGQRRGISQDTTIKKQETRPMYVIRFNAKENQLIVGDQEDLLRAEVRLESIYWVSTDHIDKIIDIKDLKVKIRYRAKEVSCIIYSSSESEKSGSSQNLFSNNIIVEFSEPQRSVTPGQSAVFYKGEEVLGGGVIASLCD